MAASIVDFLEGKSLQEDYVPSAARTPISCKINGPDHVPVRQGKYHERREDNMEEFDSMMAWNMGKKGKKQDGDLGVDEGEKENVETES